MQINNAYLDFLYPRHLSDDDRNVLEAVSEFEREEKKRRLLWGKLSSANALLSKLSGGIYGK